MRELEVHDERRDAEADYRVEPGDRVPEGKQQRIGTRKYPQWAEYLQRIEIQRSKRDLVREIATVNQKDAITGKQRRGG